jgi:4-amino-4-deoxy-L-arabinose transferase-like glycosyltransferase
MSQKASIVGELRKLLGQDGDSIDWTWAIALLMGALLLFCINLGDLPLRDWDEGTVAQVARDIWRAPNGSQTWLYPTLGGEPYLNKPPLMHWLIAIAYSLGGVNELTSRLPGALLTALSVPLLYGVGREVFHRRTPALFAALVYLTSLPVVRHGRLAMLDGALLCFTLVMFWCLLRSRRDSRYALGIGIGFGLVCMTKGIMIAALLGAIALVFLVLDTPRLLRTAYFWLGIGLGTAPVIAWYGAQWVHYGSLFVGNNLVNQSFSRIWATVEDNTGPPWYYLLELIKYGFPWLLFWPLAIQRAWTHRNLSWAKLTLLWMGVYFITVSVMVTKLPWYILPIYPALALLTGQQLSAFWEQGQLIHIKTGEAIPYSRHWVTVFAVLTAMTAMGCIYVVRWGVSTKTDLAVILGALTITFLAVTILVARSDCQFVVILVWGTYIALLLLMLSTQWNWELSEAYPVKPVAQVIQQHTPTTAKIFTSFPYHRPSLSFYSDRPVIPVSDDRLLKRWERDRHPYFLLDATSLKTLKLEPKQVLGSAAGWTLVTKENKR